MIGHKVKDRISGIIGIAEGKTEYLNGCVRYAVQPPTPKPGVKIPDEISLW